MATPQDVVEALRAAAFIVIWPGMLAVSAFVLLSAVRFSRAVRGQPVGRLVLLMVVGSVMTWAALAGFATVDFATRNEAAAIVLPLFLVWAGSLVLTSWIMHRWGAEAVRLARYHAEVEQMDRMKAQLINNVAHEINTPLTPIRFRVATLQGGNLGPITDGQASALATIERNLDRVDQVVGRMVLAMQLQAGKLRVTLRPVALDPLLHASAARASATAQAKGVAIAVEATHLWAQADGGHLATAIDALVGNAVKFTPAGGRVRLRCVPLAERVRIEVQDTGAGLSPEALAAVFDPFRTGHDEMLRTETGAGLGLHVAKGIVDLHGGEIGVESAGPGQGATFAITLQAAAPSPGLAVAA